MSTPPNSIPRIVMHAAFLACYSFSYILWGQFQAYLPRRNIHISTYSWSKSSQANTMILQLDLSLLTFSNFLTLAGSLFFIWYLVTASRCYFRTRHIPGPFFSRISYLPHLYTILTGRLKDAYGPIHARYQNSPFIVIAPDTVVTNDPFVLRHITSSSTKSPSGTNTNTNIYVRDEWYLGAKFHREYDSIASILDTAEHDRQKAKTASGYSGREVGGEFEPAIDEMVEVLGDLIRRKFLSSSSFSSAGTGTDSAEGNDREEGVNISFLLRLFTLDVITRLGYGKAFGHLQDGEDIYGFLEETEKTYLPASIIIEIPLIRRVVHKLGLFSVVAPREGDARGAGKIMG